MKNKDLIATAKKLIDKAKDATPGPWKYDCGNGQVEHEEWRIGICNKEGNVEREEDCKYMYDTYGENGLPEDVTALLKHDNEKDLEFIAEANPATVTALCKLLLEYHEAICAVKMDMIQCEQPDDSALYFITPWAVNKINKALAAAGKGGEAG